MRIDDREHQLKHRSETKKKRKVIEKKPASKFPMKNNFPNFFQKTKVSKGLKRLTEMRRRRKTPNIKKKILPLNNSFVQSDYEKIKEKRKKLMRKMGLSQKFSKSYAIINLKMKKNSYRDISSKISLKQL